SQGDRAAARAHLAEALSVFQRMGIGSAPVGVLRCLEGTAQFAVAEGETEAAARLVGAAEHLHGVHRVPLSPVDRRDYDVVPGLRAALGEEMFAAAWAQGQAMSLDEAVRYATEVLDRSP